MIVNIEGLPPLHRFEHEAMHTSFEIMIAGEDPNYARQVSTEIFREIDILEGYLSRFIENSDIALINVMSGQSAVRVSPQTLECLRVALNVSAVTGGAFDATVGALMVAWRSGGGEPREPLPAILEEARARTGMHLLELDDEEVAAGLTLAGAILDLGAIGKGYAIDQAVRILREWGVAAAVVQGGGGSTVYGLGAPEGTEGWPIGVGYGADTEEESERVTRLRDMALSASGTEIQGSHILDPRTGRPPVSRAERTWALNPSATVSDALSTAFMVMNEAEVAEVCARFSDVGALLLHERDGRRILSRHGAWPGAAQA